MDGRGIRRIALAVAALLIAVAWPPGSAVAAPGCGCMAEFEILFVYTDPVLQKSEGANEAEKLASLTKKLTAETAGFSKILLDSRIPARAVLKGVRASQIPEDMIEDGNGNKRPVTMEEFLDRVTASRAVARIRYALKADLVCLVVLAASGADGIAHQWEDPRISWNTRAFSVMRWGGIEGDGLLLAHEIGHNIGCAHARPGAAEDGLYRFSNGWIASAKSKKSNTTRRYCTLMHSTTDACTPMRVFSAPRWHMHNDGSMAKPEWVWVWIGKCGCANNVRSITRVRWRVAHWGDSLPCP